MDFILNSKTKKVEIFYENVAEQQAILNFMSQYLTYREDKIAPNIYIHDPGIGWATANAPYTISTTDSLSATVALGNCSDSTTIAAKLDNASDEGGYSCLTAYVPRPSKKE